MPNNHGDFIWYELMTNDADGAQDFYRSILGWTFKPSGQSDMDYRVFSAGAESVGGVMLLSDEMKANGARSCWMGYINVDDVDASASSIKEAGGTVHIEPRDIPDVGRFAFVNDPQGVMFYIMKPKAPADDPDATSKAFSYDEPMVGHCAWNELMTTEQDAAIAFYAKTFGWQQKDVMDMGPMGQYKFLHHGAKMIGGVMEKPDEVPASFWTYYFRAADIDEAVKKINSTGGKVLAEPQEIPGGEFTIDAIDPQGAHFALVGARNAATK